MNTANFITLNTASFKECYKIGKQLGSGAYGEVRLCVHRETGAQRAVKVLKRAQMDQEEEMMLADEISILRELVSSSDLIMDNKLGSSKHYQNICKGGELFDELSSRKKFSERDAALIMHTILMVVNYCHQKNIVHRDLKPENILLEASKDYDQIKIIDFGSATRQIPSKDLPRPRFLDQKVGTPYYIAPEVLKQQYNHLCDLWSCGVIAYVLLCGIPPFNGKSDQEIMKKVKIGKFTFHETLWGTISETAKDFITKLLQYDPEKRMTAEEAIQHKWITLNLTEIIYEQIDQIQAQGALANLKTFRADQKLKQATYTYIVTQLLSKSEKEHLSKIFKAIDIDGDGQLSKDEIMKGYERFFGHNLNMEDVEKIFDCVDLNQNNYIDYSEFLIATMNEKQLLTTEKLATAFKMFDKDASGLISKEEINEVLSYENVLSIETMKEIMKQLDENLDGEITFEKFTQMMKK
ncbi:protein kinase domain containing protein [Stylonychia lemnae]|uniref:Calcium-dependent protein kinase 1 n=1 Tax=Stylonychia lemnae TaxID=5949 RepID=A0A078AEX2_STYLE|nr:protein kinase domain containing protein [Stylonychia lemnae]|eukprot:CDW80062.1 protein kinase domain containing protein [Stylonychia lemnae]